MADATHPGTELAADASRNQPTGAAPPPPPGPDASPEEKDRYWYEHVYQGDRMPQLTLRAVLMGGVLGMLMSAANLYTTLKIGWAFGVAITACVLSYVIWNSLRVVTGGALSRMSILENNCMQSTASAAGYSTGSTIATAFGALLLIEGHHTPWTVVAAFTFITAALGVFLAIPMKRQMINQEQLPFPSGIAAATTLRSLYSHGAEAVRKAYSLVAALAVGAVVGILNTGEGTIKYLDTFFAWMRSRLFNIHLPELVPEKGYAQINGRSLLNFGFEPSVLLIAAGMIVGLRVSLSMLVGSAILYFWVGPHLIALDEANAQTAGYVVSIPVVGGGTIYHLTRWALWGGTAIMVFGSLTAFALQWKTIARSFTLFKGKGLAAGNGGMAGVEVPTSWLIGGLVPIGVATIILQYIAFDINVLLGIVAVGMSFVLALVACRATGETDTTPIGAMGKVMQLLFAVLSPGNVTHNLISAGTAANGASSSADLLTDLKSGYLLGANPRKQFLAQFIGIFFGTVAVVPAWYFMVPTKEALEKFNPPATNMWRAVADALTKGLHTLPESAKWAIAGGALLGMALPILERLAPRARRFIPSAMGLGLAWVVPWANAQAFAIGAVLAWIWVLSHKRTAERYTVPIASGLVAGESLIKALIAITATVLGLMGLNE
jgi:OPT family oligopeptide transporter